MPGPIAGKAKARPQAHRNIRLGLGGRSGSVVGENTANFKSWIEPENIRANALCGIGIGSRFASLGFRKLDINIGCRLFGRNNRLIVSIHGISRFKPQINGFLPKRQLSSSRYENH